MIVVAAMILLPACQSDTDPDREPGAPTTIPAEDLPAGLATLTPYPEPEKSELKAPDGFEPVFAQNVARHGSRTLTSEDRIDDAVELWEEAKSAGALTSAGKKFGPEARALFLTMKRVGFGNLNTLGAEEMRAIGVREGKRLTSLFRTASDKGTKVEVVDSGKGRAEASADNFSVGLNSVHPELVIEPPEPNQHLLKFDDQDVEYVDFLKDGSWRDHYDGVRLNSNIVDVSTDVLEHLYTPEFVARLDAGDLLEEADGVYEVYRSGPVMARDVNVDTAPLMSKADAEAFAYLEDGRFFYGRGPGQEGEDGSYKAAQILLDDFFSVIDDRLEGRGPHPHAAVYRFAHAEQIAPFAALMALPGSDEPGKPGETYTHENNDFRISEVAPMSANIEWVVWEKGDTRIVSVTHNEEPTTVGRGCKPYRSTKQFYELDELRSCLGAKAG